MTRVSGQREIWMCGSGKREPVKMEVFSQFIESIVARFRDFANFNQR